LPATTKPPEGGSIAALRRNPQHANYQRGIARAVTCRNEESGLRTHPAARRYAAKAAGGQTIFSRRTIVQGTLVTGASVLTIKQAAAQTARPPQQARFSIDDVVKRAKDLASAPFEGKLPPLPDELNRLNFDAWRDIEFREDKSLLGANGNQFRLHLFHLGHLYKRAVTINTIRDGIPTPLPYKPSDFDFGKTKLEKPLPVNLGFAGFKIKFPLNDPKKFDEFISFVGASYFRFLGRNQQYGLSARALVLAGGTNQEEFPFYREFWIDTPAPDSNKLTIYALLDSSVVTGALQFDCHAKDESVIEVTATLIPRRDDVKIGYAPLTSMFFIGENDHRYNEDYRPELHDSDGLLIHTGAGEWIWRPLRNPKLAVTSSFFDHDVQGYGLLQRDRKFDHYQDIALAYQLRPSYWVEPKTKFGEGHVELFEMPTTDETNDNIVASWVAKQPVTVGTPLTYSYSITAGLDFDRLSENAKTLSTFQTTARALGSAEPNVPGTRRFIVDFAGGDLPYYKDDAGSVQTIASTSQGKILRASTQWNPYTNGFRGTIDVQLDPDQTADIRSFLRSGTKTLTETWIFPWQAPATPPPPAPAPPPPNPLLNALPPSPPNPPK
jgi:glucans biosynthesis protein